MKQNRYLEFYGVAVLLLTVGCVRENIAEELAGDRIMQFAPMAGSGWQSQTKSDMGGVIAVMEEPAERVCSVFDMTSEDGALTFKVTCIETENELPPASETGTKGALVNSGSTEDDISKFIAETDSTIYIDVFKDGTQQFGGILEAVWPEGGTAWVTTPVRYWPQHTKYGCYVYGNVPSEDYCSITIDNEAYTQKLVYTVPTDTRDQKDILMGYYEGNGGGKGEAKVTLYHPLTAVQFLRDTEHMADNVSGIESIIIEGVHSQGSVIQNVKDNPNVFNWELEADKETVSQDNDGKPLKQIEGGPDGDPFLLIPQNVHDNPVKITLRLIVDGHPVPVTATVSSGEWKAGHRYIYRISYSDELNAEPQIEPSMGKTEGCFYVLNNGTMKCYVRVTMTGNIVDGDGLIISNWDVFTGSPSLTDLPVVKIKNGPSAPETTLTDADNAWNDWRKVTKDGNTYFYYTHPIAAGMESSNLFESLTQTGLIENKKDLEFLLSVQTVEYDELKKLVTAAWGSEAAALLLTE